MNLRIYILICATIVVLTGLLLLEYERLNRLFQIERSLLRSHASLILIDLLSSELKQSSNDRLDLLAKEGFPNKEGWGGSQEDITITVYTVYPEPEKRVWQFETEKEWYEAIKENYGRYQISGLNLARLDSAFKISLQAKDMNLPYILFIRDTSNRVLQQTGADFDFNRRQIVLDSIRLDIGGKDFLMARFGSSRFGMFQQSRSILFISFSCALLLIALLTYILFTIFIQIKNALQKENSSNMIIHDLKNLVLSIKRIITDIKEEGNQLKEIDYIELERVRLEQLIENLRLAAANKTLFNKRETVFLRAYINNIIERYKMLYGQLNICFSCDNPSIKAAIDVFHFGNAIMNLIDNSIKYSKGAPDIIVGCSQQDNHIHISVSDRGIGMKRKFIRHIFKKYYRIPPKDSLKKRGTGLGLFYVKTVAEKHGGYVDVESEYKKGSEFIITIPAL